MKKIPERRCLGCNESKPKKELIRVVRSPEGVISLDMTGKAAGRGAYICRSAECFKKARKSGRIAKNLNCAIPDEIYDRLKEELAADDR
ncbi:MAG: YlxR family protein [Clostridia bacterium]|nr:YlxR family protein [Clostridia bacterium]